MSKLLIVCQIVLAYSIAADVYSIDDCPVGKYRCNSSKKKCIDLNAICDGIKDCPKGDDELSSYCNEVEITKRYRNYNPGKAYINEQDHYIKIHEEKHKQHQRDHDDQGDRYWPNNGCSAGNYLCNGTLNICVKLDNICDGVQDCPHKDDEDYEVCKNWPKKKDNRIVLSEEPAIILDQGKNEKSFNGTGFIFHVENLIIYNSDVKMFNQNSDNN